MLKDHSGRKEMFYLMTHSTHFILRLYGFGHMVKTTQIAREKSAAYTWVTLFDLTARVLLYAPSHR